MEFFISLLEQCESSQLKSPVKSILSFLILGLIYCYVHFAYNRLNLHSILIFTYHNKALNTSLLNYSLLIKKKFQLLYLH